MIETLCTTCQRSTYLHEGAELFCPVCSSPLLEVQPVSDSETG
jgi:Zn finger protein HypA/HybF involved in hydrogenase expression